MARVVVEKERCDKVDVITKLTCDICGKKAPTPVAWRPWARGYEVTEVEIRIQTGERYPEGGSGEETFFDVCPECFVGKVIPAMRALGAKPQSGSKEW